MAIERTEAADKPSRALMAIYSDRSDLHKKMGEFDLALEDATTAIELSEELDAYRFTCRAGIYAKMNQNQLALADYDRALEIEPNDGYTLYNRAKSYDELQHYDKALADLNHVINEKLMKTGFHELAVVLRGEVYCMLQQYDMATQDFNSVLESESSLEGVKERSQQMLDWIQEVRSASSGKETL